MARLARERGIEPSAIIDFSANLNPLGPPDWLREVLSRAISELGHYPDPGCTSFLEALSRRFDVPLSVDNDMAIILLGHGSRVKGAGKSMEAVARSLGKRDGVGAVRTCYMSRLGPHFPEILAEVVKTGARKIITIPYFLHGGLHIQLDIPEMMQVEAARFPGIALALGQPLGFDELLVDLVSKRIREAGAMKDVREIEPPATRPLPGARRAMRVRAHEAGGSRALPARARRARRPRRSPPLLEATSVKGLRSGYTTGTCAAAAARAAARRLLGEDGVGQSAVDLPDGERVSLPVLFTERGEGWATAGVRKSAGIDATHPYTERIGPLARAATAELAVPCFRFLRPPALKGTSGASIPAPTPVVLPAPDHEQAARIAFSFGHPVLLTIGSRNLGPYAAAARASALPLYARVLDQDASIEACLSNGIERSHVIAARGPFSEEDNTALIQRLQIGVLVSKDSGAAGGVPEKLAAAVRTGCRVVMVQRPPAPDGVFEEIAALTDAVARASGRLSIDRR